MSGTVGSGGLVGSISAAGPGAAPVAVVIMVSKGLRFYFVEL